MKTFLQRSYRWLVLLAIVFLISFGAFQQNGYAQGSSNLPAWGQVPSPNSGFHPYNSLNDVEIISASDVWAAGGWGDKQGAPYNLTPMLQHWDGNAWTLTDLPDALPLSELFGVDASAPNNVWATGYWYLGGSVVLRYDGTTWTAQTPPIGDYDDFELVDVAVLAPDDVWVTGLGTVEYTESAILLFHWNGTSWNELSITSPTYSTFTEVKGIEAISPTNIWVAGNGGSLNNYLTHLYHYNGTTWQAITNTPLAQFERIHDITSAPTGEIWIAGISPNDEKGIAYFDGSTWSLLPLPVNDGRVQADTILTAVNGTTVIAANFYVSGNAGNTLIWQWNGSEWSTSTLTPSTNILYLNDMAATDSTRWAVGYDSDDGTLTEQWNGNDWTIVPSQNGGIADNRMTAIDGTGPTDVWATHNFGTYGGMQHWDGSAWTVSETPFITTGVTLEGVAARTTEDVWSVGWTRVDNVQNYNTVIFHWDGAAWSRVPSPNPSGTQPDFLYDVVALSATDAWAVGKRGTNWNLPLILRWNGTTWQNVANSCGGGLESITAISASDIWAVGDQTICHYDGTTWTAADLPAGVEDIDFNGVDGIAGNDVWAVGKIRNCYYPECEIPAAAAHWNGSTWTFVQLKGETISDVVTLATHNAYIVGHYQVIGTSRYATTILHWDGAAWRTIPSPNPTEGGTLESIYAADSESLWAVGTFYDDNVDPRTFILNAPSDTFGAVYGNTNFTSVAITWVGPVTGNTTSDNLADYGAAGLPAGAYTFIATLNGCPTQTATVYVTAGEFVRQDFNPCGTPPTPMPSPTSAPPTATATEAPPSPTPSETPNVPPSATPTEEPNPTATETPGIPPTATPTQELPTVTPSPTEEPEPPTPTSTPSVPEPLIELDPPYLEQTQLIDQRVEYQVRMTNMDDTPLVWSSYTAVSSCYAPSPLEGVTIAPAAGTMNPGAEVPMTITISTMEMAVGDHSGYVCILDSTGMIKPYPVMVHVMLEAGATQLYLPLLNRQ
jgi:hypothetical protein